MLIGVTIHLKRFHETKDSHFITFSCGNRRAWLNSPDARSTFEHELERCRKWYGLFVYGYVVMPEHVHLLLSEPERAPLSSAIQMLKQNVANHLQGDRIRFWLPRYYDFNVHTHKKHIEKLRYIHRNPVKRGLVSAPELWPWSSFRHYLTGKEGTVEIESEWTGRKRERMGIQPTVKQCDRQTFPE
jgi:putative transposase